MVVQTVREHLVTDEAKFAAKPDAVKFAKGLEGAYSGLDVQVRVLCETTGVVEYPAE